MTTPQKNIVLTNQSTKVVMDVADRHRNICLVDCLRLTFRPFGDVKRYIDTTASADLSRIFGYGSLVNQGKGRDYYDYSYLLGSDFGFVCCGGNGGTVLVIIHGAGCAAAKNGWEQRLYDWLSRQPNATITRVDIAVDDWDGTYITPQIADKIHGDGGFDVSGNRPKKEKRGDWDAADNNGLTLYLGRRDSGKFFRVYEKGKQLGDINSPWCRTEIEYKSRDRVIPLDILLHPDQYFLAAYPCFPFLFADLIGEKESRKIQLVKKTSTITVEKALYETNRCYGKYLSVFRQMYGDKKTLDLLCTDKWPNRLPKRHADFGRLGFDAAKWLKSQIKNDLPDVADAG